jgi:hypothetical protein
MTNEQIETVMEMLDLAEECGIKYNKDLVPPMVEEVTIVEEADELVLVEEDTGEDDAEKKEMEAEGWSDKDLDQLADMVDDLDDVVDEYEPGELELVDVDTGEVVDDLKDELKEDALNEVLSRIERIRAKVRFHKSAGKRARKLKIALKTHSSNAKINKRARGLAIKLMKMKLAKKPLAQLSTAEKMRIENIIHKRGKVVNRLAMRLTSRLRMVEKNRLSRKPTK